MSRSPFCVAAASAAVCLVSALVVGSAHASPLLLHVPSPDWRDQVIYFVMTDRFDDGNRRNNDQGRGEFRPGDDRFFQGGDLAGLTRRLDYMRGLGATAVWVTPPVANRPYAPALDFAGYHGYWAEHFKQLDRHLGTLADYRRLSHELHRRGMYLVQDIVVNHTADYFHYAGGWDAADPARFYKPNPDRKGTVGPRQWPFSLNDPRQASHRAAGIYHWTPDVSNYNDPVQEQTWQMSGLDDLNTENPVVRSALRDSHGWWIKQVGVDAFRVDTAFYVAPEFYADFMFSSDRKAPGVARVARSTGRRDFLVFGEGFGIDKPGETTQARKIESYVRDPVSGQARMSGMLNFPLYSSLNQVFARGAPTSELARRIESVMQVHSQPHRMATFIDNHDVDRFLAGGNEAGLKQALLALMTLPGIPVIYYGTEQGFSQQRASMFAAGVGSGGADRFDTAHPLYRYIARATQLRREHRVLSRGVPRVLLGNASGPGALMWAMAGGGERDELMVAFNTADHPVLADNVALGLPAQTALQPLWAIEGIAPALSPDAEGRVSMLLPARSGYVWRAVPSAGAPSATEPSNAGLRLDALASPRVAGDFSVSGSANPGARFTLVADGRLHEAVPVIADAAGRWSARVDTTAMIDAAIEHRLVAFDGQRASAPLTFTVDRPWQLVADVQDPAGDDTGPARPAGAPSRYTYPSDPGWGANRQLDIHRLRLFTSGGALRVEATMNKVTHGWNPANGFDRVSFSLFIELPGQPAGSGERAMPMQRAELPDGMRWHRRLRTHGWTNALFTWEGAGPSADGTPHNPAPRIDVNRDANTVRFTFPAAALGRLPSLSGAKVYLATWDYDAGFRALGREAQPYAFGGASADNEPLVMDDTPVITLP